MGSDLQQSTQVVTRSHSYGRRRRCERTVSMWPIYANIGERTDFLNGVHVDTTISTKDLTCRPARSTGCVGRWFCDCWASVVLSTGVDVMDSGAAITVIQSAAMNDDHPYAYLVRAVNWWFYGAKSVRSRRRRTAAVRFGACSFARMLMTCFCAVRREI